jgi:sucrose phosphorylase
MDEVAREVERPVVKKLIRLMEFRNAHPAFDGGFELLDGSDQVLATFEAQGEDG